MLTTSHRKFEKKKNVTSMGHMSQRVMWSWDSGHLIPCFDSCQLTIIWISIVNLNTGYRLPHYLESVTFHIHVPVVRMARLPNFLKYGARLMHALRARKVLLSLLINLRMKPLSFMLDKIRKFRNLNNFIEVSEQ